MKKAIVFTVLIALLVTTGFAQIGRMNNPPMKQQKRMMQHKPMMHNNQNHKFGMLNLTEEQQTAIRDLKLEQQKKLLPLKSELSKLYNELKLLKAADNPDLKKIEDKIDAIMSVKTKMMKMREQYFVKIKKLLTDEQKKKLNAQILFGKHKMRHRMH